jgi:nitrate/nitrite transport system ATP-binding protein
VLGLSGSGKSTLIALLSGLVSPDAGAVVWKQREMDGPSPARAVVFQQYALLPWLTVFENVALAVDQVFRRRPAAERRRHVEAYVELVNLTPARDKRPGQLSGGMRQRVALARALAMRPELLLLDEPLSALDALTRGVLQRELQQLWQQQRMTVVMVTNDIDEAILLADRIVPLTPGPRATLGPAFPVELPRPRERVRLNQDPSYTTLRNEVTRYFLRLRAPRAEPSSTTPAGLDRPAHLTNERTHAANGWTTTGAAR